MSVVNEFDSLQGDSELLGYEAELQQEIAKYNNALAEDRKYELGSCYHFGDEFSAISDEESEDDHLATRSDPEAGELGLESVSNNDHTASEGDLAGYDEVKAVKKCLRHNLQFQERVRIRLSLITAHLNDVSARMARLEELKANAESSVRVKSGFSLSAFFGCSYFSDNGGRSPPSNADVKRNMQSPSMGIYRHLRNYKPFTDADKAKCEREKNMLYQVVIKQCLEILLDPVMERLPGNKDPESRADLERAMKSLQNLSDRELAQRVDTDEIDWDKVSMTAFGGEHHAAYCRQLWLNTVSPLVSMSAWSKEEDKRLLSTAKRFKYRDWQGIANELNTNRTPVQCLSRYQIHLNPKVSNNIWTPQEDQRLGDAVKKFGEGNWTLVCSELGGRTADQCIQRWTRGVLAQHKTTHRGKWQPQEDQVLRDAVSKHSHQWVKVAKMVGTRNDRQCRERWCNYLDPDLNQSSWSKNEDTKLADLCTKHKKNGAIKWSMIAKEMLGRTDAHCRRRYLLQQSHPQAVEYVKQQKKRLIFEHRNKKMRTKDSFSGDRSELVGEDVEDDILTQQGRDQVNRFSKRKGISQIPPSALSDQEKTLSAEKSSPPTIFTTLQPHNVYTGTYHFNLLTAIQFSNLPLPDQVRKCTLYQPPTFEDDGDYTESGSDQLDELPLESLGTSVQNLEQPDQNLGPPPILDLCNESVSAPPVQETSMINHNFETPTSNIDLPSHNLEKPNQELGMHMQSAGTCVEDMDTSIQKEDTPVLDFSPVEQDMNSLFQSAAPAVRSCGSCTQNDDVEERDSAELCPPYFPEDSNVASDEGDQLSGGIRERFHAPQQTGVQAAIGEVKIIVYQEFNPAPHPRPFSPVLPWFSSEYRPSCSLRSPLQGLPLQLPAPHLVRPRHSDLPTFTRLFAVAQDGASVQDAVEDLHPAKSSILMSSYEQVKLHSRSLLLDADSGQFRPLPMLSTEPPFYRPYSFPSSSVPLTPVVSTSQFPDAPILPRPRQIDSSELTTSECSQPGLLSPRPGLLTPQPGLLTPQPGLVSSQPGLVSSQPGLVSFQSATVCSRPQSPIATVPPSPSSSTLQEIQSAARSKSMDVDAILSAVGFLHGLRYTSLSSATPSALLPNIGSVSTSGSLPLSSSTATPGPSEPSADVPLSSANAKRKRRPKSTTPKSTKPKRTKVVSEPSADVPSSSTSARPKSTKPKRTKVVSEPSADVPLSSTSAKQKRSRPTGTTPKSTRPKRTKVVSSVSPPVDTATPVLSGTTAPSLSGTTAPSLSGTTAPSLSGTTAPSLSGTTAPSLSGTTAPSLSGTTAPSLSGTTAPSLSGTTAPSLSGADLISSSIQQISDSTVDFLQVLACTTALSTTHSSALPNIVSVDMSSLFSFLPSTSASTASTTAPGSSEQVSTESRTSIPCSTVPSSTLPPTTVPASMASGSPVLSTTTPGSSEPSADVPLSSANAKRKRGPKSTTPKSTKPKRTKAVSEPSADVPLSSASARPKSTKPKRTKVVSEPSADVPLSSASTRPKSTTPKRTKVVSEPSADVPLSSASARPKSTRPKRTKGVSSVSAPVDTTPAPSGTSVPPGTNLTPSGTQQNSQSNPNLGHSNTTSHKPESRKRRKR